MKRVIALVFIAAVAALIWRVGLPTEKPKPAAEAPVAAPSAPVATEPTQAPTAAVDPASPVPAPESSPADPRLPPASPATPRVVTRPPPPQETPERVEAEAIALNLRHYGQRFGGNPVGTNAEIVKELNGGNAQKARYLPQEQMRLNDQGELIDPFGTPYFFHQLSSSEMEVRSAGPDKTLWTADDIAVK